MHLLAPSAGLTLCHTPQCRGRGRCVQSVCVCQEGFWGLDCSSTMGPDGRPALVLPGTAADSRTVAPPPLRPSFYIYDLPVSLTAWHFGMSGIKMDFGRLDGPTWVEMMLRSSHRSPTADGADYFVVPVAGGTRIAMLRSLIYAERNWPHFNESEASDLPPNHIVPPNCDDGGYGRSAADVAPLLKSASVPIKPGQPLAAALPRLLRRTVLMSCHGSHFGQFRGAHPDGPPYWWNASHGVRHLPYSLTGFYGWFVPGKDIRVPCEMYFGPNTPFKIDQPQSNVAGSELGELQGFPRPFSRCRAGWKWSRNRTRLFFQGAVTRPRPEVAYAHNVRMRAVDALGSLPGFALRESLVMHQDKRPQSSEDVDWDVHRSQFCLATDGNDGGWGSRDIEAISSGCIAVYVEDDVSRYMEEVVPHASFTLDVPESQIDQLPQLLEGRAGDLLELQKQTMCACRALMPVFTTRYHIFHIGWNSTEELKMQDSIGAFATFVDVLRARLRAREAGAAAADSALLRPTGAAVCDWPSSGGRDDVQS